MESGEKMTNEAEPPSFAMGPPALAFILCFVLFWALYHGQFTFAGYTMGSLVALALGAAMINAKY